MARGWLRRLSGRALVARLLRRGIRLVLRAVAVLVVAAVVWVLAYRFLNPPLTVTMLVDWTSRGEIRQEWRSLDEMSPWVARAAAAAEDVEFCNHPGFDFDAIRAAFSETRRLRGGSTISQQVAKNAFLWQGRSWLRKGLEAGFTVLVEAFWPKRRIMEVYLNIAETGPGVYGFPAAARVHFGKDAGSLSVTEAARIAAVLPSPKLWSPVKPGRHVRARSRQIVQGAETLLADGRSACFEVTP